MSQILVINPNSTEAVTRSMDAALDPLRAAGGPEIKSVTLAEGPPGIQSQRDVDFVVSDETTRMSVVASGGVPSLFRSGQGVVVEGYYGRDGLFHADTVLVKHNGVYRPPAPGQTPHSADLAGSGG